MTEYLTEEHIISINRKVLENREKKADAHKLFSRAKITKALEAAKGTDGDAYDKAATMLSELVRGHPFASGNR